jgi:heme exporter protein A
MALFSVTDLAASRAGKRLFGGVAFGLEAGDALILVGPNGSGKSSLLRLLAGFGRPTAGVISWKGGDIRDDLEEYRGNLHVLGHVDAVKPALRVDELLKFWVALAGAPVDEKRVEDALGMLGLDNLRETPCRFLSAGQRRRLALARLVAYDRPLWLLDEPSVGLDADSIQKLAGVIARHREGGGIVMLSTHQDLGLEGARVLSLADYPADQPDMAEWGQA